MHVRNELNMRLFEQKTDGETQPHYAEEYRRYAVIAQGDAGCDALHFPCSMRLLSSDPLRNACYHFVIEADALARVCMENGLSHDEAHTLSDIYIRKLDKAVSPADAERLYRQMCMDFAARMREIRKEAAISRHVRACINYIYENLGGDLSLKTLSRVTGLNASYLSRLFCKETGCRVRQFILSAKIDTAKNLLRHSDLPCSKIAFSLGFSSQSAFIAVFRRLAHTTPGAYRAQCAMRKAAAHPPQDRA